jgi:hypothetical protein
MIDLSKIPIGYSENYLDEYRLKSGRLITSINKINIERIMENKTKYNYIIVPISVYNIIECSDLFRSYKYSETEDDLKRVGTVGDYEIYLDIYLPSNEIILSWDKQTSRDIKINSILFSKDDSKEKRIKINF